MEEKELKIKALYIAITGPLKVGDDVIKLHMDEFLNGKWKKCNVKKSGDEIVLEFIKEI